MRRVAAILVVAFAVAPAVAAGKPRNDSNSWLRPHGTRPARPAPKPRPFARLQVVAREFSLTVSRKTLPAGRVGVELDNFGEDPHDLRVERANRAATGFSFELAKPGTVSTRKLNLGPGSWKLYCTLPGHAALGMSATVAVR